MPAQPKALAKRLPAGDMMDAVVVKAEERKFHDVYSGEVSMSCAAPPEVIYEILADLRTHVVWGGQTNRMHQRLLTIEAPDEPATVGTTFQSTSSGVMSVGTAPLGAIDPNQYWKSCISTATTSPKPAGTAMIPANSHTCCL